MFTRTGGIEPDMRGISGLSIDQLAVSEAFEASMTASSFAGEDTKEGNHEHSVDKRARRSAEGFTADCPEGMSSWALSRDSNSTAQLGLGGGTGGVQIEGVQGQCAQIRAGNSCDELSGKPAAAQTPRHGQQQHLIQQQSSWQELATLTEGALECVGEAIRRVDGMFSMWVSIV